MSVTSRVAYVKYRLPPPIPHKVLEKYSVATPGGAVEVRILESLTDNQRIYFVREPELNEKEEEILAKMFKRIYHEMPPPPPGADITSYVAAWVSTIIEELGAENVDTAKLYYFLVNYTTGYGPLCPMIYDTMIEDINVNGAKKPIVVVHRRYGHLVTNKMFFSDEDLDRFILYLSNRAGVSVSVSNPWAEFNLENRRVSIVFGRELSPIGSGISIRQYLPEPMTIVDLVKNGTMSPEIAGYIWEMIDRLGIEYSFLIAGHIGAGKTTLLNAMLSLLNPNYRIITIEETEELRLHEHGDWKPLVARAHLEGRRANLFDLLKMSLRMRPDVIVVGEIRGEEAYALFQALALGHMIASTIHAGDWLSLEKKLVSPPMNIPEGHLVLLRQAIFIRAFEEEDGIKRRIVSVVDIDYPDYAEVARWNNAKKTFEHNFRKSLLVKKAAAYNGVPVKTILEEIEKKAELIKALAEAGITEYRRLAIILRRFYRTRSYDLSVLLEGLT